VIYLDAFSDISICLDYRYTRGCKRVKSLSDRFRIIVRSATRLTPLHQTLFHFFFWAVKVEDELWLRDHRLESSGLLDSPWET
jgi:hypothetical protein